MPRDHLLIPRCSASRASPPLTWLRPPQHPYPRSCGPTRRRHRRDVLDARRRPCRRRHPRRRSRPSPHLRRWRWASWRWSSSPTTMPCWWTSGRACHRRRTRTRASSHGMQTSPYFCRPKTRRPSSPQCRFRSSPSASPCPQNPWIERTMRSSCPCLGPWTWRTQSTRKASSRAMPLSQTLLRRRLQRSCGGRRSWSSSQEPTQTPRTQPTPWSATEMQRSPQCLRCSGSGHRGLVPGLLGGSSSHVLLKRTRSRSV